MNLKRNMPRHILIKPIKIKRKEKKPAREKQKLTYTGNHIRLTADFSVGILQPRREWQDIVTVMREKKL